MAPDKETKQYPCDSTMNGNDRKIQAQKHSITQDFQISGVGVTLTTFPHGYLQVISNFVIQSRYSGLVWQSLYVSQANKLVVHCFAGYAVSNA